MTINRHFMPIIAIVAVFAVIGITRLTGDWIVSGKQIPLGEVTAADLKGWMTLEQVSEALGIPVDVVFKLAGVPEGAGVEPTTALKDLEGMVEGFETSTLREAAEAYLATGTLPQPEGSGAAAEAAATPEPAATVQPTPAATPTAIPIATPSPVPAAVEPAPTEHTPQGAGTGDGTGAGPTPLPAGQVLPYDQVKGRMTLQEVADQCAVPLEALLEALKLPAGTSPATQVKTLVDDGKVAEVETIREAVRVLQGK